VSVTLTPVKTIPRTCNVCEAMCGMLVSVDDAGRITGVRGDPDDPFSRGHICPKGPAMREVQEDPDRLRHPVRRTPGGWERVSWDEALGLCARRRRT
jgi:anaerobic selenocysteine-containing dehydrogenase